jgi:hypothetical protein
VVRRRNRELVSADFVGGVAVRRHTVGAHDNLGVRASNNGDKPRHALGQERVDTAVSHHSHSRFFVFFVSAGEYYIDLKVKVHLRSRM